MTREEDITRGPQIDGEEIWRSRLHELWRAGRLPVASADDAIKEILGVAVGMHVYEFGGEVGIDRRRRRPEGDGHGPRHLQRMLQRVRGVDQDVMPFFDRSLILHPYINGEIVAAQRRNGVVRIVDISVRSFASGRHSRKRTVSAQGI